MNTDIYISLIWLLSMPILIQPHVVRRGNNSIIVRSNYQFFSWASYQIKWNESSEEQKGFTEVFSLLSTLYLPCYYVGQV